MLAIQSVNTCRLTDAWSNLMCFYRGNYCVFFFLVYRLLWKQWAGKCWSPYGCQSPLFWYSVFFFGGVFFDLAAVYGRMWRKNAYQKECTGWQTMFLHFLALVCSVCQLDSWFSWRVESLSLHIHISGCHFNATKRLVQWNTCIWSIRGCFLYFSVECSVWIWCIILFGQADVPPGSWNRQCCLFISTSSSRFYPIY